MPCLKIAHVFFGLSLVYLIWLMTSSRKDSIFTTEGYADWVPILPQCQKWHSKRGIWRFPPFSWLDSFYTFWTELFLAMYWALKDLF